MKKYKSLSKILIIVTIIFSICFSTCLVYAHGGRTDASGGHKDNKNASGLGPYHYHCGGYPAHLHNGGVCPYASTAGASSTSTSKQTTTSSQSTSADSATAKLTEQEKLSEVYAQRVEIDVENLELIIGNTAKISAIIYPENTTDKNITWTSSDENICKIDSEGNITTNNIGKTTIIAKTSNGKQASIEVVVNPIKVTQIEINVENKELVLGEEKEILAKVYPENATDKTVNWTVENLDIVTVEAGKIIAKKAGTTKVFCTSNDGIKSETTITVNEPEVAQNSLVSNENNNENINNSEYTVSEVGSIITLIVLIVLIVLAMKLKDKDEEINLKIVLLNVISWILVLLAACFLLVSNSVVSVLLSVITTMLIAPPVCKLINMKFNNKYNVVLRFILYFVFLIITIMCI